jgi:RNA polymerase sigma factor (sigma-70 family)
MTPTTSGPGVCRSRPCPQSHQLDRVLIRARHGEPGAWRELHDRLNRLVLFAARRQGLRPAECDDVAQVTWMRLVEHLDRIRNDLGLASWLVTTATREARSVIRRRSREVLTDDVALAEFPHQREAPDELVEARDQISRLRHAITLLPERERVLLQAMLGTDEPSYREISARLAIPVGTIGPVRQRAIRRLQAMLPTVAV